MVSPSKIRAIKILTEPSINLPEFRLLPHDFYAVSGEIEKDDARGQPECSDDERYEEMAPPEIVTGFR